MCELFCLSSKSPTVATFSLRAFARHGRRGAGPVDGWGLAFVDGTEARIYREPEPAGDSRCLAYLQRRRLPSRLVISHIRKATRGQVSHANTQPFSRELGGRMHVFAHNGHLPSVDSLVRRGVRRFMPVGNTDSESAFCILLERLVLLWRDGRLPSLSKRFDVVRRFAAELARLGPANFLYTDGDVLFAHANRRTQADHTIAPPGLWRLRRVCRRDPGAIHAPGLSLETAETSQRIVLLASVPLTDEPWEPLADGEVLAIRHGSVLRRTHR